MHARSIRTVLGLLFFILILAGTAITTYHVDESSYSYAVETQTQNMERMSSTLASVFASFTRDALADARFMAENPSALQLLEGGDKASAEQTADQLFTLNPLIETIALFDDKGRSDFLRMPGGKSAGALDLSDRDYVKAALAGKEFVPSLPIKSRLTGKPVCTYAWPVRANGRVVGGALVAVSIDGLLKTYIDDVRIGQTGYPYIVNAAGTIVLHPQKSLISKNLSDMDFIRKSVSSPSGTQEYVWDGARKIQAWHNIPGTDWTVVTTAYKDELALSAKKQRTWLIAAGAVEAVLLLAALLFLLDRLVLVPVRHLATYVDKLAEGDFKARLTGTYKYEFAHLSAGIGRMVEVLKNRLGFSQGILEGLSLPVVVSDAEGRLLYVNQHVIDLLEIGGTPKDYADMTAAEFFYGDPSRATITQKACTSRKPILGLMADVATRTNKTLKCKIDATPVYDLDGRVIAGIALVTDLTELMAQKATIEAHRDRIHCVALKIEDVSKELASHSGTLESHIATTASSAESQQTRITETAAAIGQMTSTILEVASSASGASKTSENTRGKAIEGSEMVARIVEGIKEVRQQSEELRRDMASLGEQAEGIGKVLDVISDIADQTNLLALNAAIEAARAGDAGRGFAVVADEVRKLAEKTMHATREVAEAIHSIQEGTQRNIVGAGRVAGTVEQATEMADLSGASLREILALADNASDQVRAIAAASEEQSAASEEISRSIDEVNVIAGETSQAMREATRAMRELAEQSRILRGLIDEMELSQNPTECAPEPSMA
ncbi:methyl-accepting chemotaxis protein [Desulfovibrio sp. X2]|uniref:methyl-accepting chemotaxis protein n=1 Tax=Desulfovibrio sp. X2 TaxID=941449 RepID=UPI00155AC9DF|nr:methyl-accepting chemotaxis protein [Desulfovibrio sp. X2]